MQPGAATVFSCLLDTTHQVRVIFDRDVLNNPWYGCSDGTTTGYMKLRTADITGPLLAFSGHVPEVVEI